MSLTPQDLQAIGLLMDQQTKDILKEVDHRVDTKLAHQTKDIAEIIDQVLTSADSHFATKQELRAVRKELRDIRLHIGYIQ